MADFIVTLAPAMRRHGLRELRQIEGGEAAVRSLREGLVLFSSSLDRAEFIGRARRMDPIFIRHVAPVDARVELTGELQDKELLLDAVQALDGIGKGDVFSVQCRRWGDHRYDARDIEVFVGSRLEAALDAIPNPEEPEKVVSICLGGRDAFVGVSRVSENLGVQADEHRRYSRWEFHISRAEFKLREALEKFELRPAQGGLALDLGAAPGGWSWALVEMGLSVVALDPGSLHPMVGEHPKVEHVRKRAEHAELGDRVFDVMTNDMNIRPAESVWATLRHARNLRAGAPVIMTMKFAGRRAFELLEATRKALAGAFALDRAKHLFHNRRELTLLLRRRA